MTGYSSKALALGSRTDQHGRRGLELRSSLPSASTRNTRDLVCIVTPVARSTLKLIDIAEGHAFAFIVFIG